MVIPTFIDMDEVGQCRELREYYAQIGAEIASESSPEGWLADLRDIINVCDACFKEKDADVESVLNSIVSLLIAVPPGHEMNPKLIGAFCQKLNSAPPKLGIVCIRVLQNLYEGIGANLGLKFEVYMALVEVAGKTKDQIHLVFNDINKLKSTFTAQQLGVDRIQRLLRQLHRVLIANRQSELASKVMIELLSTYTEEHASHAKDDAQRCIVSFIADPGTFLMDHLLTLKPVKYLEGEKIHDLLTIFVSDKLSSYTTFYNANKTFVDSLGLDHEQNLKKMRLLTFMQMAETKKEIAFQSIQEELQISEDKVEEFIIDVLRTKLVRAKVDQVNKRVLVTSTMHRTFGRPQWLALREILTKWQKNLAHVQRTVHTAIEMTQTVPLHT